MRDRDMQTGELPYQHTVFFEREQGVFLKNEAERTGSSINEIIRGLVYAEMFLQCETTSRPIRFKKNGRRA